MRRVFTAWTGFTQMGAGGKKGGLHVMDEPKATRTVDVTNFAGIHARAATLIAELVRRSHCRVSVIKDRERVDGTDVLQILSLGTRCGEQISFEATGCDAEQVLDALAQLFADNFGENEEKTQEGKTRSR
jgi:phosphotransferase system HPr (HPr) family protein